MNPSDFGAKQEFFHRYAATSIRQRWDYFSPDHTIKEIVSDRYFRTMMHELIPGDRIQIVDKNEDEVEVKVQSIDDEMKLVRLALVTEFAMKPANGKPQIRTAGGRGRGTRYQIVDGEGKVLIPDIAGKRTAENKLKELEGAE